MPIYVYERPDGSRFELRQGFNDNALTEDPETGVPVRRVLQPAPVIFKGSGWYKTDSRATASNGATEKKTPEAAAGASAETTGEKGEKPAEAATSAKEAVSDATAKTSAEIKKTTEKPATPAAAS